MGIKMNKGSPKGIVLILLSGVVTILLFLAILILQMSKSFGRSAEAGLAAAHARLAAASGMEYAACRLSSEGYPRLGTEASRADDWRPRDPFGTPLDRMSNPSYGRGEPWVDSPPPADGVDNDEDGKVDEPGEGGGLYTVGDVFVDQDGDGRFSAWTGRLRGGRGPFGLRFALAIESSEGKVPVNAGIESRGYRRGIEHLLDNLGAVLRPIPPAGWTRRVDLASGNAGHAFQYSWLGCDLISSRPAGGYRSMEEVRRLLVDQLGYTPVEWGLFEPYLNLGPYESPAESLRGNDPYVPINLSVASSVVLRSLFRYLKADASEGSAAFSPGDPNVWKTSSYTRSGPAGLKFINEPAWFHSAIPDGGAFLLYPDEADRLADCLIGLRGNGPPSWTGIRERFVADAPVIFAQDASDLAAWPVNQRTWVQGKADLAFEAICLDTYDRPGWKAFPATWEGWGIDRDGALAGCQQRSVVPFGLGGFKSGIHRAYHPPDPGAGWLSGKSVPVDNFGVYRIYDYGQQWHWPGSILVPEGLSLAPPVLYQISCLGQAGGGAPPGAKRIVEGMFRAAGRVDFSCQEDFESLSGGQRLDTIARLRTVGIPSPDVRRNVGVGPGAYPQVVSLPGANCRSSGAGTFSRTWGALALASLETGLQGSMVWWPLREDFDSNAATDGLPEFAPAYVPAAVSHKAAVLDPYEGSFWLASLWLPGFKGSSTAFVDASFEGWIRSGPQGSKQPQVIVGESFGDNVTLSAFRNPDPTKPGMVFRLGSNWSILFGSKEWLFEDVVSPFQSAAQAYHFLVTVKSYLKPVGLPTYFKSYRSELRLFVNGSDHPSGPMTIQVDGAMRKGFAHGLIADGVDELKFYDGALDARAPTLPGPPPRWDLTLPPPSPIAASLRYAPGHFVRQGTYTSPLYVPDRSVQFGDGQWTGLYPPGFGPGTMRAALVGYATADGSGPETTIPLGLTGDVWSGASAGKFRSFCYRVIFDCSDIAGPILDSPVFESIWFTLQGNGTPAWTAWESR